MSDQLKIPLQLFADTVKKAEEWEKVAGMYENILRKLSADMDRATLIIESLKEGENSELIKRYVNILKEKDEIIEAQKKEIYKLKEESAND